MQPIQLFDPASSTYILFDETRRDALIVDPQSEADLQTVLAAGQKVPRLCRSGVHSIAAALRGLPWRQG